MIEVSELTKASSEGRGIRSINFGSSPELRLDFLV